MSPRFLENTRGAFIPSADIACLSPTKERKVYRVTLRDGTTDEIRLEPKAFDELISAPARTIQASPGTYVVAAYYMGHDGESPEPFDFCRSPVVAWEITDYRTTPVTLDDESRNPELTCANCFADAIQFPDGQVSQPVPGRAFGSFDEWRAFAIKEELPRWKAQRSKAAKRTPRLKVVGRETEFG